MRVVDPCQALLCSWHGIMVDSGLPGDIALMMYERMMYGAHDV